MGKKDFGKLLEDIESLYDEGLSDKGDGSRRHNRKWSDSRRSNSRHSMKEARNTIKPKTVPVSLEKSIFSEMAFSWYEMHEDAVRDSDEAYYVLFHDRDARQMLQRMIQFMFEKLNAEYDEDAVY